MAIIYLDQNKWIDLARAHHGKSDDSRLDAALVFVRESSASGLHVYPLSAIHYMEIAKIKDPARRARLGEVMWLLSRGRTIASYRLILTNELECALAKRFPQVLPRPLTLIGSGVAHAFGTEVRPFRISPDRRAQIPEQLAATFEHAANLAIEKSILTGQGPDGDSMLPFATSQHARDFKLHLATLGPRLSEVPPELQDNALYAITMIDMIDPLNEVFEHHGLKVQAFEALGESAAKDFIDDLPSRRIDLHLHRQVLRNASLTPKITDLEDWGGLGPAAAHCDVLVCEKHFASLLLHDRFRPHAKVLTSLRDLPDLLEAASLRPDINFELQH